jgi:hypothetical protein
MIFIIKVSEFGLNWGIKIIKICRGGSMIFIIKVSEFGLNWGIKIIKIINKFCDLFEK